VDDPPPPWRAAAERLRLARAPPGGTRGNARLCPHAQRANRRNVIQRGGHLMCHKDRTS
jgi:hypothetical protein